MATEVPIQVKIDSSKAVTGKKTVVRSLEEIRNAAAKAGKKMESIGDSVEGSTRKSLNALKVLQRGLVALGGAAVISGVLSLGDAYASLNNRLLVVSDSAQQASNTFDRLLESANRRFAPIEATVSLYQRLTVSSKELGATEAETFKFIDTTLAALALQGGAASESAGALLQLSQALGAGIVRAEEFNSILEGAPAIARAVADGLDKAGGSVSKLRKLVLAGGVTSQEFFRALLSQSEELEKQFSKIQPTLKSAGNVLRNNLIKELESSQGALGLLAKGILIIANNLGTLIKLSISAGVALTATFGSKAIIAGVNALRVAVLRLNLSIAANPIGALAIVLTTVITSIILFKDEISLASGTLATLGDLLAVLFSDAKKIFETIGNIFSNVFNGISKLAKKVFGDDISFSISGILRVSATVIDRTLGLYKGFGLAAKAVFSNLGAAIGDIFFTLINGIIAYYENLLNIFIRGVNKIASLIPGISSQALNLVDFGRLENKFAGGARQLGVATAEAFLEGVQGVNVARSYVDDILNRAEERAKERISRQSIGTARAIAPSSRAIAPSSRAIAPSSSPTLQIPATTGRGEVKYKETVKEVERELTRLEKIGVSVFDSLSDNLSNFAESGKLSFSGFVDSVIKDFARIGREQFITEPIKQLFSQGSQGSQGFAGGGIGAKISSFASGLGIFDFLKSPFSFQMGTDFVPKDMLAMVHRGERIVPAAQNKNNNTSERPIIINMNISGVQDAQGFRKNQGQIQANLISALDRSRRNL